MYRYNCITLKSKQTTAHCVLYVSGRLGIKTSHRATRLSGIVNIKCERVAQWRKAASVVNAQSRGEEALCLEAVGESKGDSHRS